MQNENANLEFRKIKSLLFLYEINSNGTIVRNVKSKRRTKIQSDKDGYHFCLFTIGGRKGKTKRRTVASMVAECWIGDRPEGYQVDHIDRNKTNNDYRNLRYATHSEQMKNRVLSERIIRQATANCYKWTMEHVAKPVTIIRDGQSKAFPSMMQCAKAVAAEYGVKSEYVRAKFKLRRSHVYDYDVVYGMQRLDTATPRGKEQSTKYLVGTMPRWNNAKRAEERDRVKHNLD